VVFSLAHALNGGYSLLGGIYYLLIGAFLALLLLRTNSIWASCGVHGAWNFTIGLLGPVSMGKGLPPVDYAMFNAGKVMEDAPYTIVGDPYYLILIGVFLAAIALLLFSGQGRLIVRAPQPAAPPPAEPEGIV
jgi:membrane protease YdiL (CAAX protease family)